MKVKHIYKEDLDIAHAILKRDELVTRRYFYQRCYPLFKSIYDHYHTDCVDCKEFIDEIYLLVLAPGKTTGRCQLENYRGESTLASWLKSACLFFCYQKFELKNRMPFCDYLNTTDDNTEGGHDRFEQKLGSVELDIKNLETSDALIILDKMPNKRYRNLVRLRYLEDKTNEETAKELGMSMENYYNKHRLAKAQFCEIYKKEVNNA